MANGLNNTQLQVVKTEITVTPNPAGRVYAGMTDQQISDSLTKVFDRPANGPVSSLLNDLLVNKSKTGAVGDNVATSMLGRLVIVANSALASDPLSAGLPLTLDWK